jgi:hypothetical protein
MDEHDEYGCSIIDVICIVGQPSRMICCKCERTPYFEWDCPRCGARLSSTDEHCPCEYDIDG